MDELSAENVNVEGIKSHKSKVPAVALSPRRVDELKRHCLENVAKNKRESAWIECKKACNKRLWHFKNSRRKREKKQINQLDTL